LSFADAQSGVIFEDASQPAEIVLAGTVVAGDAVGFSDGWKRALATAGGVIQMRCVAGQSGVSGQKITAYFGVCIVEGSRFTGATHRGALYVAESTDNGKFTQTAPSTATDATTIVGVAISATKMCLAPNIEVDSVA